MSEHRSSEFGTAMSGLIGIVIMIVVVYSLTVLRSSSDPDLGTPEQVAARIAPVGTVNLAGSEGAATAAVPVSVPAADEGPGYAVYSRSCAACHTSGAANAPKLGDKSAWEPRLAQGLDQLLQTAIDGKGAMPPRGTCMDCSDEDLKGAIDYMLDQVGSAPTVSSDAGDAAAALGTDATPIIEPMTGTKGVPVMEGMSGRAWFPEMSGEYRIEPDGSIYLYPKGQSGVPAIDTSGLTRDRTSATASGSPGTLEAPAAEGMSGMQMHGSPTASPEPAPH